LHTRRVSFPRQDGGGRKNERERERTDLQVVETPVPDRIPNKAKEYIDDQLE